MLYATPCCLQTLLTDYIACGEPLAGAAEVATRSSEIEGDFLALESSGFQLGALLRRRNGGAGDAAGSSDSDLSEPDPPASQVNCQKRVREMGGNAGGLWR